MAAALCPARAALPLLALALLARGLDDRQSFMLQAKCTLCHYQGLPFCGETQECGNRSHGCLGSCCTGAFCSVASPDVAESCLRLIPEGVSAIAKCAARGLRDCGCYANGGPLEPTTTTTTPRFYCDQGKQRGWSQLKKDWCCRTQGVACTTTLSTSTQSSSTLTTSSRTTTTRTGTSQTVTGTSRTQTTTGTSATITTTATTRSTTQTFSTDTATATRTSVTTTTARRRATTATETRTSVTSTMTATRTVVRTAAATMAASVTTTKTSRASPAATTAPVEETSRSLGRSSTASTSVTAPQAGTTLQATTMMQATSTSRSATAAGAAKLPPATSSWSTTMGRESAGGGSAAAPSITSFPSASTAAPSFSRSIRGAFSFAAPGLTLGQVEAASVVALSAQLGVAQDAITVNVVESRRLLAAEPRRLAGTWNVGYTVVVLDSRAGAVAQAATSMAGNVTGFRSVLRDAMVAQGADAAATGSSLQMKSITLLQVKSVPSEGFTSTPSPPSTSAESSSSAARSATSSWGAQSGAPQLREEGEGALTPAALPSTTMEFEKKRLPTALVYFFLPLFNAVVISSCCVYCIIKKRKARAAAREKRVSFTPSIEKEQEQRESKLRETALPDGTTSLPTTTYPVDLFCEFRESPTANSAKGPPSPIGNSIVSLGNAVSELPSLVDRIPSSFHDHEPPRLFCEEDDALEVQPRPQDHIEAHGQCVMCGPGWFLC